MLCFGAPSETTGTNEQSGASKTPPDQQESLRNCLCSIGSREICWLSAEFLGHDAKPGIINHVQSEQFLTPCFLCDEHQFRKPRAIHDSLPGTYSNGHGLKLTSSLPGWHFTIEGSYDFVVLVPYYAYTFPVVPVTKNHHWNIEQMRHIMAWYDISPWSTKLSSIKIKSKVYHHV